MVMRDRDKVAYQIVKAEKGAPGQSASDNTVVDADFDDVSDTYRNAGS